MAYDDAELREGIIDAFSEVGGLRDHDAIVDAFRAWKREADWKKPSRKRCRAPERRTPRLAPGPCLHCGAWIVPGPRRRLLVCGAACYQRLAWYRQVRAAERSPLRTPHAEVMVGRAAAWRKHPGG